MSSEKNKNLVNTDPDFIHSPKYGNSLKEFLERHDEGVENSHISKVLLMPEAQVEALFEEALAKLKEKMGVLND
jgi:hypothetical protein